MEGNEAHKQKLDLLKLFAYGTWSDYVKNQADLPALSVIQIAKLKQLTILTLAREDRVSKAPNGWKLQLILFL